MIDNKDNIPLTVVYFAWFVGIFLVSVIYCGIVVVVSYIISLGWTAIILFAFHIILSIVFLYDFLKSEFEELL
jgi:hypothetical protein